VDVGRCGYKDDVVVGFKASGNSMTMHGGRLWGQWELLEVARAEVHKGA
jgi:hypothetical protein